MQFSISFYFFLHSFWCCCFYFWRFYNEYVRLSVWNWQRPTSPSTLTFWTDLYEAQSNEHLHFNLLHHFHVCLIFPNILCNCFVCECRSCYCYCDFIVSKLCAFEFCLWGIRVSVVLFQLFRCLFHKRFAILKHRFVLQRIQLKHLKHILNCLSSFSECTTKIVAWIKRGEKEILSKRIRNRGREKRDTNNNKTEYKAAEIEHEIICVRRANIIWERSAVRTFAKITILLYSMLCRAICSFIICSASGQFCTDIDFKLTDVNHECTEKT